MRMHDARISGQRIVRIVDPPAGAHRAVRNHGSVHRFVMGAQPIGLGSAEQTGHQREALLPVAANQFGITCRRSGHIVRSLLVVALIATLAYRPRSGGATSSTSDRAAA